MGQQDKAALAEVLTVFRELGMNRSTESRPIYTIFYLLKGDYKP